MDKVKKLLKKLTKQDRAILYNKIAILESNKANNLNIKKIKESNFCRLRVKNFRIFFHYDDGELKIDDIRLKNKNTYKKLPKK